MVGGSIHSSSSLRQKLPKDIGKPVKDSSMNLSSEGVSKNLHLLFKHSFSFFFFCLRAGSR